jgi:hypothetical protein
MNIAEFDESNQVSKTLVSPMNSVPPHLGHFVIGGGSHHGF